MIRRETFLNIWEVSQFVNKWEDYSFYRLRDILTGKNNYVFSDVDRKICLILEAKSKSVAHMHIYVDKSARGRKMLDFITETRFLYGSCMPGRVGRTGFKYVFNYTKDPRVKFMMKKFGSKRIGVNKDGYTIYRTEV